MADFRPQSSSILLLAAVLAIAGPLGLSPGQDSSQQRFDQQLQKFRDVVHEARSLGIQYFNAPSSDIAAELLEPFDAIVNRGNAELDKLIPLGEQLFAEQTADGGRAELQLAWFMTKVMIRHFDQSRFEQAWQLAVKLKASYPENPASTPEAEPSLDATIADLATRYFARAGLLTNRFDSAIAAAIAEQSEYFAERENTSPAEHALIAYGGNLHLNFLRETEIRAAEQLADDLPQVQFETSKGAFVIELFENEAPQTVGNFISLVQKQHYDGMLFNVVIDKMAAETGNLLKDGGTREIDYTIPDEFDGPDARKIFAGSVVMVSEEPDRGGARFFIALAALPNFNGQRTVFGRVVSGMETVYRLNKTFKIEERQQIEIEEVVPDLVISTEIIRKRNHKYEPFKVQSKQR